MLNLGLPFIEVAVNRHWGEWPSLSDLFPRSFPGVHTGRDRFLIDIDLDRLQKRVGDYFNKAMTHEEITRLYPAVMRNSSAFAVSDGRLVGEHL